MPNYIKKIKVKKDIKPKQNNKIPIINSTNNITINDTNLTDNESNCYELDLPKKSKEIINNKNNSIKLPNKDIQLNTNVLNNNTCFDNNNNENNINNDNDDNDDDNDDNNVNNENNNNNDDDNDDKDEIEEINENNIQKKKRGRKPKIDNNLLNNIEEDKNPKKRGRKPKIKIDTDSIDTDEKTPKKRGRKPKEKIYSIINHQEQIISSINDEENIILHLPAEIDNYEKPIEQLTEDELLEYNPNINEPEPWNATTKNYFAKIENEANIISDNMMKSIKNTEQNEPEFSELYSENKEDDSEDDTFLTHAIKVKKYSQKNEVLTLGTDEVGGGICDEEVSEIDISKKGNKINDFFKVYETKPKKEIIETEKEFTEIVQRFQGVDFEYDHFELRNEDTHNYEILNLFSEANKRKEWPQQVGIACWWCCHTFNTPPIPIPYKINRGKYYVYGCCCSYNCAASYIFRENKSDMWEKYSLLNLLYKKIHKCANVKIRLAPIPLLLRMFGGPMNISEYRESFLINKKDYNILEPPLIAVNPHVEESNYDITSKGKIDNMYSSYTQQSLMKLKRNKPIMKQNNTLESYMAIQINE